MENTIKFNVECGDSPRNGYVNTVSNPAHMSRISPEMGDDIEITLCEHLKVHELHEDKKASEVIINFYLNVFAPSQIGEFLSKWVDKMCVGGILKIKFIDVRQVCRLGSFGHLPIQELHKMLLGPENGRFNVVSDYQSIKGLFNNTPCNIKYSKTDGIEIYLEIEKVTETNGPEVNDQN